ncbi:YbjN domain-containing protein [Spirulina sp. CS-785/01]|uniref:YbjN domain-containing protein n=1 Tax=Spirulina sp. CS-785/01 TaxID=3021716 RepID=UPI003FA790FE
MDTLVTENEELEEEQTSCSDLIETVIGSLEQNDSAMVNHSDQGTLWKFQYGSVEVYVQLTGETEEDLLTVWSPVLQLPAKNEGELMKKLMEMNWSGTFETCFGIFNNQIVVSSQRTVADLSAQEISRAITLVATIADDHDEALQAEFGQ